MDALPTKRDIHITHLKDKLNWPPALIKALTDEFEYHITLSSGEFFSFTKAEYLNDDFVKLKGVPRYENEPEFPRGIEVRVSHITRIADAPNGVK